MCPFLVFMTPASVIVSFTFDKARFRCTTSTTLRIGAAIVHFISSSGTKRHGGNGRETERSDPSDGAMDASSSPTLLRSVQPAWRSPQSDSQADFGRHERAGRDVEPYQVPLAETSDAAVGEGKGWWAFGSGEDGGFRLGRE